MKYFILSIILIFSILGCSAKEKNVSSYGNESAEHQQDMAKKAYKELK